MDSYQEKIEKLESENARKTQDIQIIQTIAAEVNSTLNLDQILQIVLDNLDQMFGFKHSMILLFEESDNTLGVVASHGYDEIGIGAKVPVGIGVIGTVAKHKKLMRMNRMKYQRDYAQSIKSQLQKDDAQVELPQGKVDLPGLQDAESQLAIPLLIKDRLIGVFSVESPVLNVFNLLDETLLTILGSQAAGAIDNARLYQLEERQLQELNKANEELTELNLTLEEKVRQRTAELSDAFEETNRSNKELEQFAYVTSHDLREPLRMMTSFAQSLEKRYKDKLDQTAGEYIQFIVDGAERMQTLIDDILTYSRVSTRTLPFEPVEMEEILRNALVNLTAATEETKAHITHDPLPVIHADPSQMGQVLQNLIGNAIKFHEEESPTIHISARQEGEDWLFSVKDNGIGVDPELFDRMFDLFQRLNPQDKYSGTGVGLAVTKKIVERHGGRIWVESQPGQGSTFYFTIPLETKSEEDGKQQ